VKSTSAILNSYYPKTRNALQRFRELIAPINKVGEVTKLQASIQNLSKSKDFLNSVANVIQDHINPDFSKKEIDEATQVILDSILVAVSDSAEVIQIVDAMKIALRDIPEDITINFDGIDRYSTHHEYNSEPMSNTKTWGYKNSKYNIKTDNKQQLNFDKDME